MSERPQARQGRQGQGQREEVWEYLFGGYAHGHKPLGAYAVLIGAYHAVFGGFLFAAKAAGRPLPERIGLGDLLLLGVATHKLSRTIARDWVTSVVRAPFTRLEGEGELPKELEEEPRGRGMRRAIGELLTCPFCTGQWVAALLAYGLVLQPRVARFVASVFTVISISDFVHAAWVIAGSKMEEGSGGGGSGEGSGSGGGGANGGEEGSGGGSGGSGSGEGESGSGEGRR